MQKLLHERIVMHRANVALDRASILSSLDYYGESIRSVSGYRIWLRNQYKQSKLNK